MPKFGFKFVNWSPEEDSAWHAIVQDFLSIHEGGQLVKYTVLKMLPENVFPWAKQAQYCIVKNTDTPLRSLVAAECDALAQQGMLSNEQQCRLLLAKLGP